MGEIRRGSLNIMTNEQYDVNYFIEKFEAIPGELWCRGALTDGDGHHCALGHCGESLEGFTPESSALRRLFMQEGMAVININDCTNFGPTPKARILAALHDIKAKQNPPAPKPRQPVAITPVRAAEPLHHEAEVQSVVEGRTGSAILPTGSCSHIWLDCGVCMICSATKPADLIEAHL